MTLKEYIDASDMSLTDFADLVPCSYSYPGMIIKSKARPSYEMAVRIESVTGGLVPRTNWYPSPDPNIIKEVEAELE
jgi:hypothetical protein